MLPSWSESALPCHNPLFDTLLRRNFVISELSPLFRLPREIRDVVYELVLRCSGPVQVDLCGDRPKILSPPPSSQILALTTTCRQIRTEALPLFYSINSFELITHSEEGSTGIIDLKTAPLLDSIDYFIINASPSLPTTLERWLRQVREDNVNRIPAIHLSLRAFCTERWAVKLVRTKSAKLPKLFVSAPIATTARLFKHAGENCTVKITLWQRVLGRNYGPLYSSTLTEVLPLCYDLERSLEVVKNGCAVRAQPFGSEWMPQLDPTQKQEFWDTFLSHCHKALEVLVRATWMKMESSTDEFDWNGPKA